MPTAARSSSLSPGASDRDARPPGAAIELPVAIEPPGAVLSRHFFERPALEVARALLGHELMFRSPEGTLGGIVVEVEAYGGAADPASHAFRGMTARNRVMFGPPGHAYVYFTYGMHHCVNVVTGRAGAPGMPGTPGTPGAVLIRALEPRTNLALWRSRRPEGPLERVAAGPGRVCRALGLSRVHDGLDLTGSALVLLRHRRRLGPVVSGPRVGIRLATRLPWRFWLSGSGSVSWARGAAPGAWPARPSNRAADRRARG